MRRKRCVLLSVWTGRRRLVEHLDRYDAVQLNHAPLIEPRGHGSGSAS
jgi:hypothetical protein